MQQYSCGIIMHILYIIHIVYIMHILYMIHMVVHDAFAAASGIISSMYCPMLVFCVSTVICLMSL